MIMARGFPKKPAPGCRSCSSLVLGNFCVEFVESEIHRIYDHGDDACSFFFPDGKRIVWTSTKDHPELAKSNYSDPNDYPQGSELYTSNLDGRSARQMHLKLESCSLSLCSFCQPRRKVVKMR